MNERFEVFNFMAEQVGDFSLGGKLVPSFLFWHMSAGF